LIVANLIIIALAVTGLGYYVFYRSQQASGFLADQLQTSIRQQAESSLASTSDQQATAVNTFFADMRRDITDAGASASGLLSQQPGLSVGHYWDATTSLVRLANGSWDNFAASDPVSVFLPAKLELDAPLTLELNTLKHLDFIVPGKLTGNPDAVALYFGGVSGETLYYPNIDLAKIVPPDFDVTQRPWFLKASPEQDPARKAVWSDPYLDAALHGLVVTTSVPVYDASGTFRGVIAMDVQLGRITEIVSSIHSGQTGYAFLIDRDRRLIAMPESGYAMLGITPEQLPLGTALDTAQVPGGLPADLTGLLAKMSAGESGLDTLSLGGVERFAVYRPVPEVGYSMAVLVPSQELLAGAIAARTQLAASGTSTTRVTLGLIAVTLLLASLATILLGNSLTSPLLTLTRTAERISGGDLKAYAPVRGRDEIGLLSETLNTMTTSLRETVQSLEDRVKDRTAALELASADASRRAAQFEAITRVTAAIGSTRSTRELMPLVASVIAETFGYYHVGIFLTDQATQQAYLIAANSEGGRRMLERHHTLKIGEQGIVGYVAARGEPRVARRVGEDAVFFNNPDLPATQSEAALPLRGAAGIIGVLDVQSSMENAFRPEDLRVLALLADQVSLAIENTRLFETTQRSLMEAETLYRQYVHDAWHRARPDEQVAGYRYAAGTAMPVRRGTAPLGAQAPRRGTAPLHTAPLGPLPPRRGTAPLDPGLASNVPPLRVPIKLRGETIGDLVVRRSQNQQWSQDEIDLVQAVAERVALSAENARLFDETSRRAERERLVTEITSKIRSSNDPQEMIRTAMNELRDVLGATQIQVIAQTLPGAKQESNGSDALAPDPRD
jgi:GAF domain-containing protein/HAMP domain-containing protein